MGDRVCKCPPPYARRQLMPRKMAKIVALVGPENRRKQKERKKESNQEKNREYKAVGKVLESGRRARLQQKINTR